MGRIYTPAEKRALGASKSCALGLLWALEFLNPRFDVRKGNERGKKKRRKKKKGRKIVRSIEECRRGVEV